VERRARRWAAEATANAGWQGEPEPEPEPEPELAGGVGRRLEIREAGAGRGSRRPLATARYVSGAARTPQRTSSGRCPQRRCAARPLPHGRTGHGVCGRAGGRRSASALSAGVRDGLRSHEAPAQRNGQCPAIRLAATPSRCHSQIGASPVLGRTRTDGRPSAHRLTNQSAVNVGASVPPAA